MVKITLRRATAEDIDLLDELHTATMRAHVERVYPWKPYLFRATFDAASIQIVIAEGKEIGMLQMTEDIDGIYVRQISIAPDYQRHGIGTMLMDSVLSDARRRGVPVRLRVLRGNQAIRLYERLGFRATEQTATHVHMMAAS